MATEQGAVFHQGFLFDLYINMFSFLSEAVFTVVWSEAVFTVIWSEAVFLLFGQRLCFCCLIRGCVYWFTIQVLFDRRLCLLCCFIFIRGCVYCSTSSEATQCGRCVSRSRCPRTQGSRWWRTWCLTCPMWDGSGMWSSSLWVSSSL